MKFCILEMTPEMTWVQVGYITENGTSHIAWFSSEVEASRMATRLNGIVLNELNAEPQRLIEELKEMIRHGETPNSADALCGDDAS